jgi:hypothetical protein
MPSSHVDRRTRAAAQLRRCMVACLAAVALASSWGCDASQPPPPPLSATTKGEFAAAVDSFTTANNAVESAVAVVTDVSGLPAAVADEIAAMREALQRMGVISKDLSGRPAKVAEEVISAAAELLETTTAAVQAAVAHDAALLNAETAKGAAAAARLDEASEDWAALPIGTPAGV